MKYDSVSTKAVLYSSIKLCGDIRIFYLVLLTYKDIVLHSQFHCNVTHDIKIIAQIILHGYHYYHLSDRFATLMTTRCYNTVFCKKRRKKIFPIGLECTGCTVLRNSRCDPISGTFDCAYK